MSMDVQELLRLTPSCCDIGFAHIDSYSDEEQSKLLELLATAKSVIVVGHHIKESLEWSWFNFETERGNNTCAADLHIKGVVEKVSQRLESQGFKSVILPYPGRCGILFKSLAAKTGMGQLGDSFLFLHPLWGPWVHLRVLVTEAEIEATPSLDKDICIHCGRCISECPGNAIGDGTFDGNKCNEAQAKESKRENVQGYIYKCEICARVCPVGNIPQKVQIINK